MHGGNRLHLDLRVNEANHVITKTNIKLKQKFTNFTLISKLASHMFQQKLLVTNKTVFFEFYF